MSKPIITAPTKSMSWEEFYDKTDNANKLMDRVWYAIACTDPQVAQQKVFWEHWYWSEGDDDGDDDGDGDDNKKKLLSEKTCSNHTLTIDVKDKTVDYPIWPVKFSNETNKEYMKMYPAIDLKCFVIAPFGLSMTPIQFPTDDSPTEFRVDYAAPFPGVKMYFIFALTPHMSDETKTKCYAKMEEETGVKREWFHDIQWDPEYQIGSTGEPDINPKK